MISIDHLLGRIHQTDCLPFMKSLPDKCVDLVLTDPPYGLEFPYISYLDTRDNLKKLIHDFILESFRITKRGVFILPGPTQINLYPQAEWCGAITWDTTGTFGKYGYNQWTPILCYGKDLDGFGNINGITKSDVIRIAGGGGVGFQRGEEEKQHTCPKPISMMKKVITRYTGEIETIFDPFMGSGTTAVACERLGRKWFGCELEPKYCEIANKRIEAERNQLKLF